MITNDLLLDVRNSQQRRRVIICSRTADSHRAGTEGTDRREKGTQTHNRHVEEEKKKKTFPAKDTTKDDIHHAPRSKGDTSVNPRIEKEKHSSTFLEGSVEKTQIYIYIRITFHEMTYGWYKAFIICPRCFVSLVVEQFFSRKEKEKTTHWEQVASVNYILRFSNNL